MKDDVLTGKVLDGKDGKDLIAWVGDNQLPGETDATRASWLTGTIILAMKKRYPRAHLSQLVTAAYHVVCAAESVREMEKRRQQAPN